jgi:hypothetical protein
MIKVELLKEFKYCMACKKHVEDSMFITIGGEDRRVIVLCKECSDILKGCINERLRKF